MRYETHWMEKFQESYHDLGNVTEITCWLFHVEALAKAQVSQDIENEPVHPVTHVKRGRPFAIFRGHSTDELEPSVDVRVQENLSVSQCCL